MKLPKSVLVKSQKIERVKEYIEDGKKYQITAKIRYDDECNNGHNTFSITGEIRRVGVKLDVESCGCIHDEIAKHFPDLKPFLKWHLVSSDGPTHYIENSIYLASDRDCWGLLKGEKRQIVNGKSKLPCWHLVAVDSDGSEREVYEIERSIDALEKPDCEYKFEYRPWYRVGDGKEPDLKAAREAAIWPEAELSDFTKEKLEARLPALMKEFKLAVQSLGLKY